MTMTTCHHIDIFWGGGNRRPGILRDMLEQHIHMVPSGGTIDWVTYYFRDRRLAKALVRARRRGVKVNVAIDARPRTANANDAVISILEGPEGLGSGFKKIVPLGRFFRLHTKLYCFSHPYPHAFIGSFNPSGDNPEAHPEIIQEIGDQYRGFNLLVQIRNAYLAKALMSHARWIHRTGARLWLPASPHLNRTINTKDMELFFLPRILPNPVRRLIAKLDRTAECRIAASHIKGKYVINMLLDLARKGCKVEILAEATRRRVPYDIETAFIKAGIKIRRIGMDTGLPMHDKFMLISCNGSKWVTFGSFNWTSKSMLRNQEIGVITSSKEIYSVFDKRWQELITTLADCHTSHN